MATSVITISSDVSEESVGFVVSRVILFSTIPTEVLIVPDIPTNLPSAPKLPAVSPFLCSDDSESEPADELPERHVSLRLYDDVVSRWSDRVRFCPSSPSGSSSPNTTMSTIPSAEIPVAPTPPGPSTKIAITSPACDISTLISLEDHLHHSSKAIRSPSGPLTRRRPQCSDYATHASFSSAGPSRKRSRSLATSIPSTVHTAGALSLIQADLLPPHKRYMGTSAMHSDESGNEGSPEIHRESDMDSDIRADIEAETAAAAAIVDGRGGNSGRVRVGGFGLIGVEMGIKPGLAVVESESEPEEAKADDEADVEVQLKGTIKIRVDVTTGIDIPNKLPMPDTIKRLEQLKESVQGMYGHMLEIPLKRIEDIEAGQTDLQARKLIADGERSGLLERIVALEGSNTRL
ncbi:hypothetical protein Tco_0722127 [Tanacetum coccineum]